MRRQCLRSELGGTGSRQVILANNLEQAGREEMAAYMHLCKGMQARLIM